MLDTIGMIIFLGFFGFLIYDIMTRPKKEATTPPPPKVSPPSPVGLFCWICHMPAGTVSAEEYERISRSGEPPYCTNCAVIVETYKARQEGR